MEWGQELSNFLSPWSDSEKIKCLLKLRVNKTVLNNHQNLVGVFATQSLAIMIQHPNEALFMQSQAPNYTGMPPQELSGGNFRKI